MNNDTVKNVDKENSRKRVFGNNLHNVNACSTSDQSWPLESFTNPYPFVELTNQIDLNTHESGDDYVVAKTQTKADKENSPPPYSYRTICPACKKTNYAAQRVTRPNQSPIKLVCKFCKADFCENCHCSPFHRRAESCPSILNGRSFGGRLFKKMR